MVFLLGNTLARAFTLALAPAFLLGVAIVSLNSFDSLRLVVFLFASARKPPLIWTVGPSVYRSFSALCPYLSCFPGPNVAPKTTANYAFRSSS